jgi:hypothetical protein
MAGEAIGSSPNAPSELFGVDAQNLAWARTGSAAGQSSDGGQDVTARTTHTALGGRAYGLSLYRRKRWEPLPFEGTLEELADTMNHDLAAWADDWS